MNFNRLNNMTGMDPVLIRRITSVFIIDFETFHDCLSGLAENENIDSLLLNLQKIRSNLVIFELDKLIKQYDQLAQRKREGEKISKDDKDLVEAILETENQLTEIKEFINSL